MTRNEEAAAQEELDEQERAKRLEAARQYGYFDALYGRASDLPIEPEEHEPYLQGYGSGMEERVRWNQPREVPAAGEMVSVRMPAIVKPEERGVIRNQALQPRFTPKEIAALANPHGL